MWPTSMTMRASRWWRRTVAGTLPIDGPVHGVFNLASPASPPDYLALPLETLAVGSEGTRLGLELAHRHGARFLLASTSEVYGDPEVHPQTESYWGNVNSVGPRSVYDEAKRFAEALTMAHHRAAGHRRRHRPHLQHLRTAAPSRRRPGGVQLPGRRRSAVSR